jgi:hypothetical protein
LAWVNATRLQQIITDRTGLQDTGELIVGIPEGQEVHLLLPSALDPSVTQIKLAGAIELACVDMANGTTIERDYRGVVVIVAYTPLGYSNWGVCPVHMLQYLTLISVHFSLSTAGRLALSAQKKELN